MLYNLDEAQYQYFWQTLKNHPKAQLHTDGIQIKKVSWAQSLFQRFKGWLGFDNHCQTNKVELTLAKVAYYGYLKGYHTPNTEEYPESFISHRFRSLINLPRTNNHSAELQQIMMNYYGNYLDFFPEGSSVITDNYSFGQTLIHLKLYEHLPGLDPQDNQIISNNINNLRYSGIIANKQDYLADSRFAAAYAEHLVQYHHYLEALDWSPNIYNKYKEEYIGFYLEQEHKDPQALVKATALLAQLANSPKINEQNKAIAYIKDNFDLSEQLLYLAPYKDFKKKVAQSYFNEALQEKNKYTLTKLFTGNNTIPLLVHALQLNPQLFEHPLAAEELPLKVEWLHYSFSEAILNYRFKEARTLFEQNPQIKFDQKHLSALRNDYSQEIHLKTRAIKEALEHQKVDLAENLALELIELAKKIALITPQDNPLIRTTIDYAATLVAIDEINHPNVAEADILVLNKAQALLNEHYTLNPSTALKQKLNHLLLRKIDYLMEQVKGPIGFGDSWKERTAFADNHKSELNALQSHLTLYIALNEKEKAKELRAKVAKMHYILADMLIFFLDNKNDARTHFSAAAKIMDKNPYYQLRYLELTNDDKRHEVRQTITELTTSNEQDYKGWLEERWNEGEKSIGRGFEIHDVEVSKKGFFASLF